MAMWKEIRREVEIVDPNSAYLSFDTGIYCRGIKPVHPDTDIYTQTYIQIDIVCIKIGNFYQL